MPEEIREQQLRTKSCPEPIEGTGKSASTIIIEETHAAIKNIIKNYTLNNCNIYILYGGSVNDKNASDIVRINNVDGFLIGTSSLDPKIFYNIYNSLKGE